MSRNKKKILKYIGEKNNYSLKIRKKFLLNQY
jgi:hypothetical protein